MSTKIRFFSFLLAVLMFASVAQVFPAVQATAAGNVYDAFIFDLNEDGTSYTLSQFDAYRLDFTLEEVVIPSTYNGLPVTAIGASAFRYGYSVTSIIIPNSITSIGNYAFSYCNKLKSITIPKSVTSIGVGAINPESLESIVVEEGNSIYTSKGNCLIETATKTLLAGCKNSVIPTDGSVTSIATNAFFRCDGLTSISIPYGVTSIGYFAFASCDNLTGISIPDGVTFIDELAFSGCKSLTSITIPDSVTSINRLTFSNCTALADITLSKNITSIGEGAFERCESLKNIVIPDKVTSIGKKAFSGCYNLASVTIPSSVTSIGDYAFQACLDLTSVMIPEGVTSIGEYAFSQSECLKSISIPNSVTSIGYLAFKGCPSIESIVVADGNKFYRSENNCLIEVATKKIIKGGINSVIPSDGSITSIEDHAFSDCSHFTDITFPDGITNIGEYAFFSCDKLKNIAIPKSVTSIGDSAFANCFNLESITVDKDNLFYNSNGDCLIETKTKTLCVGCKDSIIPTDGSVTTIAYGAFMGNNITAISIPNTITSIASSAFSRCQNLTSVTIPNSVTSIGSWAFSNCTNLSTFIFVGTPEEWEKVDKKYGWNDECSFTVTFVNEDNEHKHIYSEWSIHDTDLHKRTCSCGVIEYTNHTWDSGVVTTQPTCIDQGIKTYTCSVCKATKTDTLPATYVHSIQHIAAVAPTCTTWGNVEYWYCDNCGYAWLDAALTLNTALKYVSLEPAHQLVHVDAKASTCSTEGNIEYWYCSLCDWMEVTGGIATNRLAVILPAAHSLVHVEAKASCFEEGNIEYWYCSLCDWMETSGGVATNRLAVILPALGSHTVVHVEAKAPTAYANGNIEYWYCAVCGYAWLDEKCTLNTNLLSVILPATGVPASEGLAYELNSDGTAYIVTGIGTCQDTDVVIPSSYNGLPVTSIAASAFEGNSSMTGIYIPSTISSIEKQAFRNCKKLKATYIEDLAAWCKIVFGSNWSTPVSYSGNLYLNGELLVDLVIPESVTVLEDYAFYGCTSIKTVVCHDKMTSLGLITFYGCKNLESIVLPANLERLEKSLFINCTALKSITLPDSLKYIGMYAFQGSGIESITIPAKVTSMGTGAFSGTANLQSIIVDSNNKYFKVVDNCLIQIKSKTLLAVCGDYTIPTDGSVTAIGAYAFYKSNLSEIVLPNTITAIASDAFSNAKLTSMVLPSSVVSIGSYAFNNCQNLKVVYIPASVKTISMYAFSSCKNITVFIYEGTEEQWNAVTKEDKWNNNTTFTVIFAGDSVFSEGLAMKLNEDGTGYTVTGIGTCKDTDIVIPVVYNGLLVTSIGMDAFSKTNITSIVIPHTVQLIDRAAFADCTSLNDVTFTGTKAQILAVSLVDGWNDNCPFAVIHCTDGDVSFGPDALEFTLNESGTAYTVTGIGTCKDTDIVIPAVYNGLPVTAIADYAFEGNKSITSITIPDGLVSIGYGAFYKCTALKKVVFSKSVSTLDNFILYGCTALTELVVEEGHKTLVSVNNCIIDYTTKTLVYGCAGSKIPEDGSVTTIGSYAFVNSGLTSIVIPDAITTIDFGAFENCRMLESIHIGSGTTSINSYAFQLANPYIKSFTIDENNPAYMAVNNCLINKKSKQLIVVFSGFDLPTDGSIKTIGQRAFADMSDITSIVIPEGVTSIGDSAFIRCTKLTSITFPSTLKSFTNCPFLYCDKLETVTFHKDNETFTVINNCIVNKTTKTLVAVFGDYEIPSDGSVTVIGNYAFQYKSDIKRIELPVGITTINKYAFRSCTKLETIVLPNTITNINDYAFNNCRNLKTIIFNGTEEQWNNVVKSKYWNKGNSFTITFAGEPVHTHSFSAWIGQGEVHTRSCACGAVESQTHSWSEGVITTPPTVVSGGVITSECVVCKDQKMEFIPAYKVPDIDGDGKRSMTDAQIVMQYITGGGVELDEKAADINGDGEVNIRDVAMILQAIMYDLPLS